MILTLDPGATSGVALFYETGSLKAATKCKPAEALVWASGKVGGMLEKITMLVHERPQIYERKGKPGEKRANPNAMMTLHAQALDLRAELHQGTRRTEYLPAAWKAQVPKPIHHGRILSVLTIAERASLPTCKVSKTNPHGYDNNMLDAIGLGLFYLGRMDRGATRK